MAGYDSPEFKAALAQQAQQDPGLFDQLARANQTGGGNAMDLMGTSLTTPSNYNLGTNATGFTGFYNPHGGSSFIGIRDDGTKQMIDKEMAMRLGYVPSNRTTLDQYGNVTGTTSGAQQVQDRIGAGLLGAAPPPPVQAPAQTQEGLFNSPEFAAGLANNPDFGQALVDQGLIYGGADDAWTGLQEYQDTFRANRKSGGPTSLPEYTDKLGTLVGANQITEKMASFQDGGGSNEDIKTFFNGINILHNNNPEDFAKWEQQNPEMAVRWHAQAAHRGGTSGSQDEHNSRAQQIAYDLSQQAGYGEDGRQDGKEFAFDYDTFRDINNKDGMGDFWKIGQANTTSESAFGDFLNNPIVNLAASAAAPFTGGLSVVALQGAKLANGQELSPEMVISTVMAVGGVPASQYLQTAGGLSAATANALVQSAGEAIQGGDLKDIALAGGTSFLATKGTEAFQDFRDGNPNLPGNTRAVDDNPFNPGQSLDDQLDMEAYFRQNNIADISQYPNLLEETVTTAPDLSGMMTATRAGQGIANTVMSAANAIQRSQGGADSDTISSFTQQHNAPFENPKVNITSGESFESQFPDGTLDSLAYTPPPQTPELPGFEDVAIEMPEYVNTLDVQYGVDVHLLPEDVQTQLLTDYANSGGTSSSAASTAAAGDAIANLGGVEAVRAMQAGEIQNATNGSSDPFGDSTADISGDGGTGLPSSSTAGGTDGFGSTDGTLAGGGTTGTGGSTASGGTSSTTTSGGSTGGLAAEGGIVGGDGAAGTIDGSTGGGSVASDGGSTTSTGFNTTGSGYTGSTGGGSTGSVGDGLSGDGLFGGGVIAGSVIGTDGSNLADGLGVGDGTGTGTGDGDQAGSGSGGEEGLPSRNTAAILTKGEADEMFDYTKLTPSARALLGPYIDHMVGLS